MPIAFVNQSPLAIIRSGDDKLTFVGDLSKTGVVHCSQVLYGERVMSVPVTADPLHKPLATLSVIAYPP